MPPRARQLNAAAEQPSVAPSTETSNQPVNSRKKERGSKTRKQLPQLVIRRPQGAAAMMAGIHTCHLRVSCDSPIFQ
jgi:hypothetical protein